MSRHLDWQTGLNITIGNQNQFQQSQKGARVTVSFPSLIHTTAHFITCSTPGPVGLWCWCNLTWPGPDQPLAACHVTSATVLSLPLCSHPASSSLQLYFSISPSKHMPFSVSPKNWQGVWGRGVCSVYFFFSSMF